MILGLGNTIPSDSVRQGLGGGGGGFDNTYSLAFDGVDDYVDVGNPTELQITGALSISAWVKFTGNVAPIVSKYESGSAARPKSFGLEGDRSGSNHSPKFFIYNSGTIYETPTSVKVVDDGNWHHLLAVFNPSTYLRLYIDGNLEQENTTSIPATIDNDSADFVIGAIKSLGNPVTFFSGNIDEVAVWNSDQSANIDSIYSATGAVDLTSLNPTAWYRMGDNGSYKSPQWLIPENSNKDKVSNYNFEFDGVDDEIRISSPTIYTDFTLSFWYYQINTPGTYETVVGRDTISGGILTSIAFNNGVLSFKNRPGSWTALNTSSASNTEFKHFCITYDSTANELKGYCNGTLEVTTTPVFSGATGNEHSFNRIGSYFNSYRLNGYLDEIAVFNTVKNATEVNSLYGGGTPSAITGATNYYRLGEEANFTDNWLVNNSALSNYSTRSFNFNGVDDYIETTKTAALTTASLSMWVKVSGNFGVNERQSLASNDDFNHGRDFIIADTPTTTNDAYIAMFAGAIIYGKTSATGGIPINDGNWHHLVWTYDGSAGTSAAINMYVDGQNQYSNSTYSSFWSYEIKFQYFGKPVAANTYFDGSMDEVAYFNSILSESDVTSIYNSGVPADLSSYSPISWWRMGEDATFSTNWSLPDNGSGSNTGTSANMDLADLEGDAPNYTGGGLSANMTIDDRIGDAPNSTSNALSYNMTESDREENTPPS